MFGKCLSNSNILLSVWKQIFDSATLLLDQVTGRLFAVCFSLDTGHGFRIEREDIRTALDWDETGFGMHVSPQLFLVHPTFLRSRSVRGILCQTTTEKTDYRQSK